MGTEPERLERQIIWLVALAGMAVAMIGLLGLVNYQEQESAKVPPSVQQIPLAPTGGEEFLPHYINYLTGKEPWPKDQCQVKTAEQLLLPCDQPSG